MDRIWQPENAVKRYRSAGVEIERKAIKKLNSTTNSLDPLEIAASLLLRIVAVPPSKVLPIKKEDIRTQRVRSELAVMSLRLALGMFVSHVFE